MSETRKTKANQEKSSYSQQEDAALKTCMQFFADELLPYLGIEGKVKAFAPTELVHLELLKLFEDFNLEMEDRSWKHFEFQSTNEGLHGLKRFRVYEALASYQHKVEITTYVLYSGGIKNPMTSFTEGVNTYRVVPIIMADRNADQVIAELQRKLENHEVITKADLLPLTLCPLMGGKMSQKERIQAAYGITQKAHSVPKEDVSKIEAVIYAMMSKFLSKAEQGSILEEIGMTRIGQMLVDKGIEQGTFQTLCSLVKEGKLTLEDAAKHMNLSEADFCEKMEKAAF